MGTTSTKAKVKRKKDEEGSSMLKMNVEKNGEGC